MNNFSINLFSIFFAFIILLIFIPVYIYSIGYLNEYKNKYSMKYFWIFTIIFVMSMMGTVFAANSISFMFFWEIMSISSFFLVIFEHKNSETIKTGIFYFIMTHISGLILMIMFGLIFKFTGKINFMDITALSNIMTLKQKNIIFALSIAGFGAKAGIMPLHAWLPKAHPTAPSNISALMSGVMLKIAIYGFILINFVLININNLSSGLILLLFGVITAIFSIINALFQKDIKSLLAYSSAENIGIIFSTLGLSLILKFYGLKVLMLLSMSAALFHILNHSVFKSLLFTSAGSVLYATHTKNMNELGGLYKTMKRATIFAFIGVASISAMPPLNGFASESLIFRSFVEATKYISNKNISLFILLSLMILAITSAGAVYSAVKFFGITYLGEPRSKNAENLHKLPYSMEAGMGILSFYSIALGIFSPLIINLINFVAGKILTIESIDIAFVSNEIIYISLIALILSGILIIISRKNKIERYETWGCGFNSPKPFMQYSGDGFSQPASRYFGFISDYKKEINTKDDISMKIKVHDVIFKNIYKPISNFIFYLSDRVIKIHYGKIQVYILYIFIALVFSILISIKLL